MRGFIVHPTYRVENGKALVYLFGRLECGESFLIINEFRPYFYIRKDDLQKAIGMQSEIRFDYEHGDVKTADGFDAVKILTAVPSDVPKLRDSLAGIRTYEADIRFAYRYLINNDIRGTIEIDPDVETSFEKGEHVDRIYRDILLRSTDPYEVGLSVASIDIETDMTAGKVHAISIWCGEYHRCFIVSEREVLRDAVCFKEEKEMLKAFSDKMLELDPDIITGWNVIGFDLRVLQERFKANRDRTR